MGRKEQDKNGASERQKAIISLDRFDMINNFLSPSKTQFSSNILEQIIDEAAKPIKNHIVEEEGQDLFIFPKIHAKNFSHIILERTTEGHWPLVQF